MYNYCMKINSLDEINKAAALGVYNIEIALPLEAYSPEELEDVRNTLIDSGMKIVLLTSTLGADDREGLRRLFLGAHLLNVECIMLCEASEYAFRLGENLGISVVFENCADDAVKGSASAGIVFDPVGYVKNKKHPFLHAFTQSHAKSRIRFLRIADALYDGTPTEPGKGSAEIKELASILLSRSFDGYFALREYGDVGCDVQIGYIKKVLKNM